MSDSRVKPRAKRAKTILTKWKTKQRYYEKRAAAARPRG